MSDLSTNLLEELETKTGQSLLEFWDGNDFVPENWDPSIRACEALVRVSTFLRLDGRYGDALDLARQSLELAKKLGADNQIGRSQAALGRAQAHVGDIAGAARSYQEATSALLRANNYEDSVMVTLWFSYLEQTKGLLSSALSLARTARDETIHRGLQKQRRYAIQHEGLYLALMGKLKEAVALLTGLIHEEEFRADKLEFARTCLTLGLAETYSEEYEKAWDHIESARRMLDVRPSNRDLAISYEYEALLHLYQSDFASSSRAAQQCITVAGEELSNSDVRSQALRILAEAEIGLENFDEAHRLAIEAHAAATKVGEQIELGAVQRVLGQCHTVKGNAEEARQHFTQSLDILWDIGSRFELAITYRVSGTSTCYDDERRLRFLYSSLALFDEMGTKGRMSELETAIASFQSRTDYRESSSVPEDIRRNLTSARAMWEISSEALIHADHSVQRMRSRLQPTSNRN